MAISRRTHRVLSRDGKFGNDYVGYVACTDQERSNELVTEMVKRYQALGYRNIEFDSLKCSVSFDLEF
jgi:hypothetical protein